MKLHTRQLTCAAIVGAAYAVLSIFGSIFGITYGPIQCRFSEALCVLPFLFPETAWGLGIGCLIANVFSPYGLLDIVVGSCATFLAALLTARCKQKWLAPLPPVMLGAMAHRWEVLRQENAPLRAVVNGRVRSVGEDFYDEMIRRHLPEGQTKIANIIGEVLGREKPGIGDVWLAERIRQMLSTGELRMLREDRERFYRSVVERT